MNEKSIKIGCIYSLKSSWHPYEEAILNHRPVIVIKKYGKYADALSAEVTFKFSDINSRMLIEYYINGDKRITNVSCDIVQKIPYEYFLGEVGFVETDSFNRVINKAYNSPVIAKVNFGNVNEEINHNVKQILNVLTKISDADNGNIRLRSRQRKKVKVFMDWTIGFLLVVIGSLVAHFLFEYINYFVNH